MTYPSLGLFVGGRWIEPDGRSRQPVFNPSNGEVLGELPHADAADLEEALESAASGFGVWRKSTPDMRAGVLAGTAALMRQKAEALARTIALELGKPIAEARMEVAQAAGMFDWAAEEARRAYGRVIPARQPGLHQYTRFEPLGPVAAFSPWNAPLLTPSRKISSTLAAGCPVVIKPSEETPGAVLLLARIIEEAGLPPGVLNVVFGDPAAISATLIDSPVIRGITFTGSTEVGKLLGQRALAGMKRPTLELGGHAPVVVFADVDVEKVAAAAAAAKFRNAGQICTSPTRFYIQSKAYVAFRNAFLDATNAIVVGDGLDPQTTMGPLANERRLDAMDGFVSDARRRGVPVAAGGRRLDGKGWFYRPTVLADVPDTCRAANVEPFGPLALLAPFETAEDAVEKANRLPFGLAAYVMTHDSRNAAAMIEGVESGNVIVNHWRVSFPETPFGGHKDSGIGAEGGPEGIRAFQVRKFVSCAP